MSAFTPSNIPCNNTGASISAMTAMTEAYNDLSSKLQHHIDDDVADNVHSTRDYVGDKSILNTQNKTSVVAAVNEINTNETALESKVGSLSNLHTTARSNIVSAINEVSDEVSNTIQSAELGELTNLDTDTQVNVVAAINEVNSHADTNADNIATINNNIDDINDDIDDINDDIGAVTDRVSALESDASHSNIDNTVICKDYTVVFNDQIASNAQYVGSGRYAIAEVCVTNDANRFTKEAVAFVKHVNTKPFDAIVTMTITENDTPTASMIVQISKANSDWTDLEFAILKTTDSEHKVHYVLTLKSSIITPYGGNVNTNAEPGSAQNDNVNLALRVSGMNIIPLGKTYNFPACNDDNVLISKIIGEGTQYVTLDGLTVRGSPLANLNDIQVATEGVPTGTIIRWGAWSGAIPTNPPEGYVPCNGLVINSSDPDWNDYTKLREAYGYPAGATSMTLPDEENSLVKIS